MRSAKDLKRLVKKLSKGNETQRILGDMIQRTIDTRHDCFICGKPRAGVDIFAPHHSRLWGAPENRRRVFVAAVCQQCADDRAKIEGAIMHRLGDVAH